MIGYLKRLLHHVHGIEVSEIETIEAPNNNIKVFNIYDTSAPRIKKDNFERDLTWIHECTEVTLFDIEIDGFNLRRKIKVYSSKFIHNITIAHLLTAFTTGAVIHGKNISVEEYCSYFWR